MDRPITLSVVTITRGDGPLLARTVESVHAQKLPRGVRLEHIIVDGNDSADTPEVVAAAKAGSVVLRVPAHGCYDAMNKGLEAATGDIVGLLHGTDFYADGDVLAHVVDAFADGGCDFVYGDVCFVKSTPRGRVKTRYYSASRFCADDIKSGFAPPHPSLYMTRKALNEAGLYKTDYRNAADFEYFVRLFFGGLHLRGVYMAMCPVLMEDGGASSTLFSRLVTNSVEKRRALREHGISISWPRLFMRYLFHLKMKSIWKRR